MVDFFKPKANSNNVPKNSDINEKIETIKDFGQKIDYFDNNISDSTAVEATRKTISRGTTTLSAWTLKDGLPGLTVQAEKANVGTEFAGRDAPKMKFLYTLSFKFGEVLTGYISEGSDDMASNTYDCKTVTRPNINITYTEVNSYNYRTRIPTKMNPGTVTVTFYDDNDNTARQLLQAVMQYMSPITNISSEEFYLNDDPWRWSSIGGFTDGDVRGAIRSMRITHHFSSDYTGDENSHAMIHYDYMNPQLQDFNWEELDMGASESAMITATFVYDSVNITQVGKRADGLKGNQGVVTDNNRNGSGYDGERVENIRD